MIWLSVFVTISMGATAIYLLKLATRRLTLRDRIIGLVPGAKISSPSFRAAISRARRISKKQANEIDLELPDLIELMAVALSSGLSIHQSIERVACRSSARFSGELKLLLKRVTLGSRYDTELTALCDRVPTAAVREFANKISIALTRGTPLVLAFNSLCESLRARQSNILLARAGANETKMLIPLVTLVLPTTVIFAIYPSVQFLSLGFI